MQYQNISVQLKTSMTYFKTKEEENGKSIHAVFEQTYSFTRAIHHTNKYLSESASNLPILCTWKVISWNLFLMINLPVFDSFT